MTNFYRPIFLFRLDERTGNIYILAGDELEVEVSRNGRWMISDMKLDFDKMSKAELRAYIVAHPNNQEAFYKFVDRFKANSSAPGWHPFPQTHDDWAKVSELIQEQINKLEE